MSKYVSRDIAIVTSDDIKDRIYVIRGLQVMLDSDLAKIYGYEVRALNQQVKRNISRFPEDFMFELTKDEVDFVKSQTVISPNFYSGQLGGRRKAPLAFTEQGIYMLATILSGELAEMQTIAIMRLFKEMHHFIADNAGVFQRLERVETKLLSHDEKFDKLFKRLEITTPGNAVIFFNGMFYDAKSFITELVKRAKSKIILIDDYVSKATLDILRQRNAGVVITLITSPNARNSDRLSEQEIKDFIRQYGNLEIKYDVTFHDRFLILDDRELYSIGASLKDAGNKTFAISKIEEDKLIEGMLDAVSNIKKKV